VKTKHQDREKVFAVLFSRLMESGNSAIEFLGDLDREQFKKDRLRQSAVSLALGNFGETAGRIMEMFPEVVQKHPDVEWRNIKGLRNRIFHDYFEIDFELIYEIVKSELPRDLKLLSGITPDLS